MWTIRYEPEPDHQRAGAWSGVVADASQPNVGFDRGLSRRVVFRRASMSATAIELETAIATALKRVSRELEAIEALLTRVKTTLELIGSVAVAADMVDGEHR
jgi:hypothetical protein